MAHGEVRSRSSGRIRCPRRVSSLRGTDPAATPAAAVARLSIPYQRLKPDRPAPTMHSSGFEPRLGRAARFRPCLRGHRAGPPDARGPAAACTSRTCPRVPCSALEPGTCPRRARTALRRSKERTRPARLSHPGMGPITGTLPGRPAPAQGCVARFFKPPAPDARPRCPPGRSGRPHLPQAHHRRPTETPVRDTRPRRPSKTPVQDAPPRRPPTTPVLGASRRCTRARPTADACPGPPHV